MNMGTQPTQQFVRQPQSAEVGSSLGSQFENPLTAEQLAATGLLDSSFPSVQNQEGRPDGQNRPAETLGFKEQFGTIFSAPQAAGEQLGLHGMIFDRAETERQKQLAQKQNEAQSIARSQAETQTAQPDHSTEQEIRQLTLEVRKQAHRNKAVANASGRGQTLGLQSEQAINTQDKSSIPLLRQMIADIVSFARRKKQVEAHLIQSQRANKKKAILGLEGGADKRSDAIAQMRANESSEDQGGDGE
jgi:hypothetical protein